ncbi:hypothetical protein DYB32_003914 [Aphanomyces invadans]|uniref:RanBP2-type domain-containing protein n=2 Tax=Aphanomyces invadans TaxID=157072 RepID=A0A418AZ31_9STRA|nr:hypothetical protein DYB32_003914 [Aphanomyces invadans]
MKRSFEEDVGEATARGTRQRRNDHGGWGVLSFFKHVPLLNKLVATNDDDDDEIEDIAVDKDDAPSPKRPTQQQPKSPLRRTSAATPTHENKRSFTFPRSTGDDEVKASASPAKPCFESNGDQGTNAFVFTRKSHNSTPNKQQKVFPSSVHDQAIDVSDFYTPGSFAPRHTSAKATEHVQPPTDDNTTVLPIQLFSDSSNPSRLSRGGLIKKITLSREERRQKRPVPSRLLANHSTNAREHSKMITERILATLSAMDADPLAKETQKPAPSLSMSWGKYHLDLVEQESAKASAELDLQQGMSRPPVNSLGSLLPKKSPVAQTLAVPVAAPKEPSATPVKRKVFLFGFSTPEPASGSVAIDADILLNKPVKYTFSKPNKVVPSKNATSVLPTKPYQFVSPPVQAPTIIRHASPPSASSLPSTTSTNPLDKFKIRKAGSWTCSACLVNNLDAKLTQCPSCETPKDASSSAPAATPATPSTNPLAKFMQHAPGSWACPSCKVRNGPSQSKCPCCETAKPGDDGTAVKKSSDSAPSFGFTKPAAPSSSDKPAVALGVSSEDKPAFSFGVSSKESPIKVSFGVAASAPSATESKLAETPAATSGFSFGASAAASSAASEKPASGAFSFSLDAKSDKPTTSTDKPDQPAPCSDAPADKTGKPAFSFGAPADAKPAASDSAKPAFSFGAPALKPAPSTKMPAIAVDASTDKPTTADKPTFVFGASNDKPAAPSDTPAFTFGSTTVKPVTSSDKPAVAAPTFAFGKPDATAVSGQNSSIGGPGAFSFTAPSTAAASETKAPALGFGDSSTSATVSKDAAPTFTLEPKSKKRSVDGEGSSVHDDDCRLAASAVRDTSHCPNTMNPSKHISPFNNDKDTDTGDPRSSPTTVSPVVFFAVMGNRSLVRRVTECMSGIPFLLASYFITQKLDRPTLSFKDNSLLGFAASNGHLSIVQAAVKHFHHQGRCKEYAIFCATVSGQLQILEWLFTNYTIPPAPPISMYALNGAAKHGHLNVLQFLHAHRCTGWTADCMDSAAAHGHLNIVKFLHYNRSEGCTTFAMNQAAENGHLDVVRFLHENRTEGCTSFAMNQAAKNGHLSVVKFLHTHRTEGCTTYAMTSAAFSGHLSIVQFLHFHRQEGCTKEAMDGAALYGHLDIVKFLHEHRSEGCTEHAINWAASRGSLDIVRYLHANREEGSVNRACALAARFGHATIVNWFQAL